MKILFDLTATQSTPMSKTHGGGGRYCTIVFFKLIEEGIDFDCVYDSRRYLREDVLSTVYDKNIKLHDEAQKSIYDTIIDGEYDVFYSALTPGYLKDLPAHISNIGTIHGLRDLEMPRDWWFLKYKTKPKVYLRQLLSLIFNSYWKNRKKEQIRSRIESKNYKFVTVSEHTKYSILAYYPNVKDDSIKVFYSPSTSSTDDSIKPHTLSVPYILLVNGNRPEKNALRALKAFDEIVSERPDLDYHIIITGTNGDGYYTTFKNTDRMHFVGYVSENELESLFKGASIFIYPTLNEGFGYPPLEAMHYGVPVLASPTTSISEVCGDAALYFNPFDVKEIKARLLRMMIDKELRELHSEKSLIRFKMISERQEEDLKKLVDFIKTGGKMS